MVYAPDEKRSLGSHTVRPERRLLKDEAPVGPPKRDKSASNRHAAVNLQVLP